MARDCERKPLNVRLISETDQLTNEQLVNLVFHPGLSTKEVTTEVSGRGVGMDVVKTNIDKMGGRIAITSEVGQGSTFRIQIPLSLGRSGRARDL